MNYGDYHQKARAKIMDEHTKEAGLEICKQLGIDPARVLGINIFVLNRTLVVKTLDGVMNCSLVEDRNEVGDLIFRIVKCPTFPIH